MPVEWNCKKPTDLALAKSIVEKAIGDATQGTPGKGPFKWVESDYQNSAKVAVVKLTTGQGGKKVTKVWWCAEATAEACQALKKSQLSG